MGSPPVDDRNADQAAYWNGAAGRRWVARQETLDRVLAPIQEVLLDRAGVGAGERVIDVGCGCGTSTIALARLTGPNGRLTGVDISAAMLARARERTPVELAVDYVLADATLYAFEAGRADLLFSRFGVMFFAEPTQSFRNLYGALRPGGRLAFGSWREPRHNPWMLLPLHEAYRHVPKLPELGPEDPGPFSFAREDRVRRILNEAGFTSIAFEAVDLTLDLAVGRGLDAAVTSALEIGPVSRAVEGQPAEVVAQVESSIRTALAARQQGETVPLGASVWIVTAACRA
ncbi:MAG TPA: class I SAM-dependent methyltransferase [Hyphomicrobiaceae bacterium]|nr:class I SAM-dependent methyltransferase [Hyphomicrobiaceae bacterium]